MEKQLTIDKEIAKSLVDIMLSKSKTDMEFALNLIENRDVSNKESENCFINDFLSVMIQKEHMFMEYSTVVKLNGNIIPLNGKSLFKNPYEAQQCVYKIFNSYIGKGQWHPDPNEKNIIEGNLNKKFPPGHPYYQADITAYIKEREDKFLNNIYAFRGGYVNPEYFKMLRRIFKSGQAFADYLLAQKILTIERI